jgi:hypothetical protein
MHTPRSGIGKMAGIACAICLSTMGAADDGAITGVGGAIALLDEHPQVRMAEETVRVKLPEGKVHCEFVFHNEGRGTTVKMGFPESGGGDWATLPDNSWFRGFRTAVDGQPAKVKRVVTSKSGGSDYHIWWVKWVRFGPKQRREVTVDYQSGIGGDSSGNRFFEYGLKTGSSWKGHVGYARVECDISGLRGQRIVAVLPNSAKRKGNLIVSEHRNTEFEGESGRFIVCWWPYFDNFVVNGVRRPISNPVLPCQKKHPPVDWRTGQEHYHSNYPPSREGNEVPLHVRTAACLLGLNLKLLDGRRVRLYRDGSRWCEASVGSKRLKGHPRAVTAGVATRFRVHGEGGRIEVPVTAVVRALGGSARWDSTRTSLLLSVPWKLPWQKTGARAGR